MERIDNNALQKFYFASVERGNIGALHGILKSKSLFDINASDSNGKTALQLAIESGRLEVVRTLLNHDVYIGDALFHAIEAKFVKAIELILDNPQGKDLIDAHAGSSSEDIHPDTTPLILAAHHNDYDIIKLLLKRGATPIACTGSSRTEKHTIQHSVGTLNVYKALASEAYMSVIEFETELCEELRRESSKEYEFREQYLELAAKCEQYAADLLGHTRDSNELNIILSHSHDMDAKDIGKEERPMKVLYAVNKNQKKVRR
ncbi:short transient receptor potential channel 4-like [Ptychodera flava]|uniref:short transient receptor potential channel 4-like n=1 Tax=Ptychodera flava TaxID=63121 RepID=UPI00396A44FB